MGRAEVAEATGWLQFGAWEGSHGPLPEWWDQAESTYRDVGGRGTSGKFFSPSLIDLGPSL